MLSKGSCAPKWLSVRTAQLTEARQILGVLQRLSADIGDFDDISVGAARRGGGASKTRRIKAHRGVSRRATAVVAAARSGKVGKQECFTPLQWPSMKPGAQ